MKILNKTSSVSEFTESVVEMLKHLDGQIFKKPAIVLINKEHRYANFGLGGFQSKRWLFRVLGLPDSYVIFEKSKSLETEIKKDYKVTSFAAHEVRHRFQLYNKKSLISENFILKNSLLPKQWIDLIVYGNHKLYPKNKKVFTRELDASLIDSIISYYHKHPKLTIDMAIDLIVSSEDTIKGILTKLS